jgi:hypothetical protein
LRARKTPTPWPCCGSSASSSSRVTTQGEQVLETT